MQKPDKWSAFWQETYTLTRVTDDQGNPDGTEYEITYVDGIALPVAEFTNTYMEGSAVIRPVDITAYMNGEEGYEGVVSDGLTGEFQSSDSLPETGCYVTLPDEIDAMLKEVWQDSGDITEVTDDNGAQSYVLDLSDYVTFKILRQERRGRCKCTAADIQWRTADMCTALCLLTDWSLYL